MRNGIDWIALIIAIVSGAAYMAAVGALLIGEPLSAIAFALIALVGVEMTR